MTSHNLTKAIYDAMPIIADHAAKSDYLPPNNAARGIVEIGHEGMDNGNGQSHFTVHVRYPGINAHQTFVVHIDRIK